MTVRHSEGRRKVLVANTDGVFEADDQIRTLLSVNCVASGDQGLQTARKQLVTRLGLSYSMTMTLKPWHNVPPDVP